MRHVGQEFRFVFRGEGKLLGLFLQCAAGLFDFLVLAFDFNILFRQLLRFLCQLLVSLLQFFLLRLQFCRQLLRLLQQPLSLHGRFNTIEHNANAGGKLIEKCQLQRGEVAQRC